MPLLRDLAIGRYFANINDPRIERTKDHSLLDIIIIAIAAVICGADGWVDVEEFGLSKHAWLTTFLDLPNGIPSHDTFGRVFARIDPEQFQCGFLAWVQAIQQIHADVIAIDGKTLRGSYNREDRSSTIHMISAYATANKLVLGQLKTDKKSNESVPWALKLTG